MPRPLNRNALAAVLVQHGLLDPCAVDDPEGYDNGRTLRLLLGAAAELNEILAPTPAVPAEPQWIQFVELPPNPKTRRWRVDPRGGGYALGEVRWHGPWRKYCFFPAPQCVFEEQCLRDLITFCTHQTQAHRAAAHTQPHPQHP